MRKAGRGSIILTASQMGQVAWPGSTAYCTTKGAILQLVKGIALDHKDENIRCNSISPGGVATDRLLARWGDMETAEKEWGPKHALGRLGQPFEIASGAVFLGFKKDSGFALATKKMVKGIAKAKAVAKSAKAAARKPARSVQLPEETWVGQL